MVKISAGLLMYRIKDGELQVFLVHPGGPYFTNKDEGFWGIPKGEVNEGESLFNAALREFEEETGIKPHGDYVSLGDVKLKSGKIVHAWAFMGEWDGLLFKSNYFAMEWPTGSGQWKKFPEIDKASFFSIFEARKKMSISQSEFITRLEEHLKSRIEVNRAQ